jgi:PleD family two-component response regulator
MEGLPPPPGFQFMDRLFTTADMAPYEAKDNGRDQVRLASFNSP